MICFFLQPPLAPVPHFMSSPLCKSILTAELKVLQLTTHTHSTRTVPTPQLSQTRWSHPSPSSRWPRSPPSPEHAKLTSKSRRLGRKFLPAVEEEGRIEGSEQYSFYQQIADCQQHRAITCPALLCVDILCYAVPWTFDTPE